VVTGFSDFFTSTIDADALAAAIFDLLARNATGLLNVAARESVDKAAFLRTLAEALNVPMTRVCNGSVQSLSTPRAGALGLDVRRAEEILGYRLPDLATVVAALVRSRP
jgi:dTDP-4-dehydrorhamnose reductase